MNKVLVPIIIAIIIVGLLIFLVVRHHREKYIDLSGEWKISYYITYNEYVRDMIFGGAPIVLDSSGKGYQKTFDVKVSIDTDKNTATVTGNGRTVTNPLISLSPNLITFRVFKDLDMMILNR